MHDDAKKAIERALKKITKGGLIVLVGSAIGMILSLFNTMIITRVISKNDFGIYTLGLTIATIGVNIGGVGLARGLPRLIGFYRGKKNEGKVYNIIYSSFKIALLASIIFTIILVILSPFIADLLFHIPNEWMYITIMVLSIPFTVLLGIIIAVFQGMEIVKVRIYFQNIVFRISIFSLFIFGFIFVLNLKYFVLAYLIGTIITLIISAVYAKIRLKAKLVKNKFENVAREILVFSAPLWTITLLSIVVMNVSILSLGFFRNPESVASFRIGHALAHYIALILSSVGFLFTPIVSFFYAQKKYNEIKEVYITITKWLFLISFPLFLVFFLFPSETISIIYTAKYTDASLTLQLVGISFIIHTFLGPNMNTLVAYGDTRILSYIYVIQTIICIILALTLIPLYGLTGAALTFFISLSTINILTSMVLYYKYKIHPFKKHYLLPAVLTLLLAVFIYYIYYFYLLHSLYAPVIFFPIFLLIYILISTVTKSITEIDKVMINAILGKIRKTYKPKK